MQSQRRVHESARVMAVTALALASCQAALGLDEYEFSAGGSGSFSGDMSGIGSGYHGGSAGVGGPQPGDDAGLGPGDAVALSVSAVEPPDKALDVAIDASVRLTFSEPLDAASVSADSVRLLDATGVVVPATLEVDEARVTLTPLLGLVLASRYTLRLTTAIQAKNGSDWTAPGDMTFQTRDGSWREPASVSTVGDSPRMAFDEQGNAVVIWGEAGQNCVVGASRYVPGAGWSRLPNVPLSASGTSCIPQRVAAMTDGTFALAWYSYDATSVVDYHAERGFGTPLNSSNGYIADAAARADRSWFVSNSFSGVVASRFSGTEWQATRQVYPLPAEQLGPAQPSIARGPVIALESGGSASLFWSMDEDASTRGVYRARYSDSSDWGFAERIEAYGLSDSIALLQAAGSPSGFSVAVWESDSTSSSVDAVRFAPDGSSSTLSIGNSGSPAVAAGARDDALIAWLQSNGAPGDTNVPARAWASFHAVGASGWSAFYPLSSAGTVRARPPNVALDASGNGLAVWVEVNALEAVDLFAARFIAANSAFDPALAISAARPVSPTPSPRPGAGFATSPGFNPQVAVDRQGRALVVWVGPAGGIWAARFD